MKNYIILLGGNPEGMREFFVEASDIYGARLIAQSLKKKYGFSRVEKITIEK